jgi:hypothetical protein
MSDKIEYSRLLVKRSNVGGEVPTIPPLSAVTLNQFTPTDLFVGEFFANVEDDRLWIRTNTGLVELNTSGTTGTTVVPTLVQVLNEGNNTGGFDIVVSSGNTIIYSGLSTGSTTQYLGLDANGRTIITAASGGSGTSGTSGSSGRNGTNGTNGSSGVNGASGTNGSSGTSGAAGTNGSSGTSGAAGTNGSSGVNGTSGTSGIGTGAYLPLSGGTVTGNTTFTQNLYLTNLTSGGSSTYLTVDSDTGQVYTALSSGTGTSGTSGSSGRNGTNGSSGVNGTSGTNGSSGVNGTSGSSGTNGAAGTNGSSGVNGTSGTSGTGGGGGTSLPGIHFNFPLTPNQTVLINNYGAYAPVEWTPFISRVLAYPVVPAQDFTFSAITLDQYNASTTTGETIFALYDDLDNYPNNMILSSTTISNASGYAIKQYNVTYTMSAGTRYWLATAFNDAVGGAISTGFNMPGLVTIRVPEVSDGYGVMLKYAVSNTIAAWPNLPSTFDRSGTYTFNGGYVYDGYFGGTAFSPMVRLKTSA